MPLPLSRAGLRRLPLPLLGLLLTVAVLGGGAWSSAPASSQADSAAAGRLYDLQADEAQGGHTLARHVGKTDRELAERLSRERHISAASTYPDIDTARRVVAAALARSRRRVDAWANRTGRRPNLVLNYRQPGGHPIGRSLARGARVSESCNAAVVVLRWDLRRRRWFVLTSYPETSR